MANRRTGERVVLRGVIDCVVQKNDGSFLVVEFKTGRPSRAHQRQLDLYVDAATAIYSGSRVEGRLVYAD
jgi:ATP-dependent exoDNAse (exonuclease V) beta subunit